MRSALEIKYALPFPAAAMHWSREWASREERAIRGAEEAKRKRRRR